MPQNDLNKKDVKRMLEVIQENKENQQDREDDLETLKDLKLEAFEIEKIKASKFTNTIQTFQIIDSIWRKLTRPSASYFSDGVKSEVAQMVHDGVITVMEEGGFNAVLTDKPSAYNEALSYGDAFCRVGVNKKSRYKVSYDNVVPTSVFVDSNATIMHSQNSTRSVTRIVLIYSYDEKEAKKIYPDVDFFKGEIPRDTSKLRDFDKTEEQDMQAELRKVEVAHYFDIGENPTYLVAIGRGATIATRFKGLKGKNKYPFISKKTDQPYIPIGQLRNIDADEGFFNFGFLHLFYKLILARQQLFNKQFGQTMRAMTDTKVLNTGGMSRGQAIKALNDAKRMAEAGQESIIINPNNGEPMTVSSLEAQKYEQGLANLQEQFDREIKRVGINLDAIREAQSTTATQIISEQEVEDALALHFINKNTEFFKFIHLATMDLIRDNFSKDDKTPVRTSVKFKKIDEVTGEVIEERFRVTIGDIKEMLDEHEFFVEMNTKSGVRQRDSLKTARAIALANIGAQNPLVANQAVKAFAEANNITLDDGTFEQPAEGKPTQQGIQAAAKNVDQLI